MRLADKSIMGGLKVSDVDSFSMALDSLGQPHGARLVGETAKRPGLDSAAGSWVGRALRVWRKALSVPVDIEESNECYIQSTTKPGFRSIASPWMSDFSTAL